MAVNILDTIKVHPVNIFVRNPEGRFSLLENVRIIQFDIIGLLTEIPEESGKDVVVFFPWGSIQMVEPLIPEVEEATQ